MKDIIDLEPDEYIELESTPVVNIDIDVLKKNMEQYRYYPTRELVLQTALNILKMTKDGQVGQGIHAICLDGPPGAGKSFYVKTYQRLLEHVLDSDVEMISYQCNTSTSKAELYEEINVAAAIAGDSNKVIISGKLVQAVDLVNQGKKVIVFLDEYDKAREETDSFLLNFLQDGEIDTTQRGKVKIKEKYLKNLQVMVCKNDNREELSGPLTRRLKFLKLDYMKPSILCKTIENELAKTNFSIRNAVTLLYTAMYESKDEFPFSRLPACSECMQAIKDAETLMEIGADKTDIVTTAIIANMVKSQNDIEIFIDLTRSRGELVEWYNRIMEAIGNRSNVNELERLKHEMAKSFYPEQLREVSKELEEEKRKLEEQRKKAQSETAEYMKKQQELANKSKEIEEKEKELRKREVETEKMRKSASEDAKKRSRKIFEATRRKTTKELSRKR